MGNTIDQLTKFVAEEKVIDLFEDWYGYLLNERRCSKKTIVTYRSDVANFLQFLNKHLEQEITIKSLMDLGNSDFRSWLVYRNKNNHNFSSSARALSVIRSFYRFLTRYKNLDNQAVFNIKTPKIPKNIPKAIDEHAAIEALESTDLILSLIHI